MGTTTHHREERTMTDRDPRYTGGRIWGAIAIAFLVIILAALILGAVVLNWLGAIA